MYAGGERRKVKIEERGERIEDRGKDVKVKAG